jgi:hypothetical protein
MIRSDGAEERHQAVVQESSHLERNGKWRLRNGRSSIIADITR